MTINILGQRFQPKTTMQCSHPVILRNKPAVLRVGNNETFPRRGFLKERVKVFTESNMWYSFVYV